MSKYCELKSKHEKEFNAFPMFFVFSNSQFDEGMRKMGLDPTATDKIYSIGGGGYMKKSDSAAFAELIDRLDREMREAMQDDEFLIDAFDYELSNHEYIVTWDTSDAIEALGFTVDEVTNDKRLLSALKVAVHRQNEWYKSTREA